MSVKLFVTDLDGTLLETGSNVPQENIDAVKKMAAAGITVTVATGRMYKAALPVALSLAVDVPIITYNGALIKSVSGKTIASDFIASTNVREALDFCFSRDWYIQLYSDDELYYAEQCAESDAYEAAQNIKGHAVGSEKMKTLTQGVTKLLLVTSGADETAERIKILREKFSDKLDVTKSNANYAEIVNPGVSKAAAVKKLAAHLGVAIDDVWAIGDSDNDLPMLKAAGKSIAMGNAAQNVKESCDFVTGRCEDFGFAAAVYKYVLGETK